MEKVVVSLQYNQEIDYFEIDLDSIFNSKTSEESYQRLKKIVNHIVNRASLNLEEMKYYCLVNGLKEHTADILITIIEKEMPNIVELKSRALIKESYHLESFNWAIRNKVCSKQREIIKEPNYGVMSFNLLKDSNKNVNEINLNCSKEVVDKMVQEVEKIDEYLKMLSSK